MLWVPTNFQFMIFKIISLFVDMYLYYRKILKIKQVNLGR